MNGALFFFIVSVVHIGLHQISHYNTLSHLSQYFGWIMKINLPQVKTLLSVCLKLSQSKNILFHLNSIGYTCYSCDRIRRGLLFFIVSAVYTRLHKISIKVHCLARFSIFGGLSKNVSFRKNYCLQFVSFCHSLWTYFPI